VWANRGQQGTIYDIYNTPGVEDPTGSTNCPGSRVSSGALAPPAYQVGMDSKLAPTDEMLLLYDMLLVMTRDLDKCMGPITNNGSQDLSQLTNFLSETPGVCYNGIWTIGESLIQGFYIGTNTTPAHQTFSSTVLGASLFSPNGSSYFTRSGSRVPYPDMIPEPVISPAGNVYSVRNSCLWGNDVLVNNTIVGAIPGAYYQNLGSNGPYLSAVYTPNGSAHVGAALVEGWALERLNQRGGGNTQGRLGYFMDVLVNAFACVASFTPAPTVEVFNPGVDATQINFLGNVQNNPLSVGMATVSFSLAKSDLVDVKVFDVSGRLVKSLASRQAFKAGPSKLVWDGRNDQGQTVPRGVYFTQVKFINSGFVDAKKLTVLK